MNIIERLLLGMLINELGGVSTVFSEWLIKAAVQHFLPSELGWRQDELLAELDVHRQKGFKFLLPLFAFSTVWGVIVMGMEEARAGRPLPSFLFLIARRRYLRWKIHVISTRLSLVERVSHSKLRLLQYIGSQVFSFGLFVVLWGGTTLGFGWLTQQLCVGPAGQAEIGQVVLWFLLYALTAAGLVILPLRVDAVGEAFAIIPDVLWFGKYKNYTARRLFKLTKRLSKLTI